MKKNKIKNLVIGSDGFIGNSLCNFLKRKGEGVIRFDIKRSLREDGRFAKITSIQNVDRIYFLAWDVGGAKYLYSQNTQITQLDWNLRLLTNIMPQLEKSKKKFLFISSQLAEETDTVYGVTKRLGEVWSKIIGGNIVRQWNVYGPIEENYIKSHVISDLIRQAVDTGKIKLITTGQEKRQFIHIEDVCNGWHKAINEEVGKIYDITSFQWIKIIDIAKIIGDITGAKVIPGKEKGRTPITPIKGKMHGWKAEISIKRGLTMMVNQYKNEKRNKS